jgi:Dyp-type peroxidase family
MAGERVGWHGVRPVVQRDLQGNILCGYGRTFPHGLYLFFRIADPAAFRGWLGAQRFTTAESWGADPPPSTLNIALTWTGLRAAGVPDGVLKTFPAEFRGGMEARADRLGDSGDSDPAHWDVRLKRLHGVITTVAQKRSVRDKRKRELKAEAQGAGLEVTCAQETDVRRNEREPFGFADGISQPAIDDPKAGPWHRPGEVRVKPGEFVLGYEDEGGVIPPAPAQMGANGSYMVVRKLDQDPDAFWKFVGEEAGADGAELLAAKIVGRLPDGTPLIPSRRPPDPRPARDGRNDFTYAGDPDGYRCPIGAHIRRANPRDSLDGKWRFANRHRVIRRGMPYWPDAEKPGLVFVCFQACIERQFEFVQSQWLGDGNAFGLGSDPDVIAGPANGKMTIQGVPPRFIPMHRFITTRGGDYFFAPGNDALHQIAALG